MVEVVGPKSCGSEREERVASGMSLPATLEANNAISRRIVTSVAVPASEKEEEEEEKDEEEEKTYAWKADRERGRRRGIRVGNI